MVEKRQEKERETATLDRRVRGRVIATEMDLAGRKRPERERRFLGQHGGKNPREAQRRRMLAGREGRVKDSEE